MSIKPGKIYNDLIYGGLTEEQFSSILPEIRETNRKNACIFTSFGIILLTIALVVSAGNDRMVEKRTIYAMLDIIYVMIVLVNLTVAKGHYLITAFTGMLLQYSLLGWGIFDALIINADQPTTLFLPFVALIPLLFSFPPVVNAFITLSAAVSFLVLMRFTPMTEALIFMNTLHVVLFSILGIGMGIYMTCVKLSNHYMVKQQLEFAAVEREAAEARMQSEYEKSQKELMEANLTEVNELNAQLSTALAAAQQASNAKSLFLNSMSHDIRTPMNAIIGFTTLASSHIDNKEQVLDYLDKISSSGEHLLSLINDVLDMSRIESGRLKIEEREVHLPEMIRELKSAVSPAIVNHKLELFIDTMDVTHEDVICDRLRLKRILLNIVSNAVKYNRPGGSVTVRISEEPGALAGCGDYVFLIRDTGIGMSEEFREHIFESFSREQTSTVSGIPGTGLGMAITRNLVEMMGGAIEVESEVGKGTQVTVRLCFRLGSPADCREKESRAAADPDTCCSGPRFLSELRDNLQTSGQGEEEAEEENEPDFTGRRLLLVEDNVLNQEIAVTILEEYGFVMDVASDGIEAVEKMEQAEPGRYEMILMDIQMPVMNGYEATRAIRAMDPVRGQLPIFAMTANVFEEDRQKAFDAGMNGYIPKPINVPEMLQVLAEVLQ